MAWSKLVIFEKCWLDKGQLGGGVDQSIYGMTVILGVFWKILNLIFLLVWVVLCWGAGVTTTTTTHGCFRSDHNHNNNHTWVFRSDHNHNHNHTWSGKL